VSCCVAAVVVMVAEGDVEEEYGGCGWVCRRGSITGVLVVVGRRPPWCGGRRSRAKQGEKKGVFAGSCLGRLLGLGCGGLRSCLVAVVSWQGCRGGGVAVVVLTVADREHRVLVGCLYARVKGN